MKDGKFEVGDVVRDKTTNVRYEIASIKNKDYVLCHMIDVVSGYNVGDVDRLRSNYPNGNFERNVNSFVLQNATVTHIVVYYKGSCDPFALCYSEKEAKDFVTKLFDDNSVIKSSIRIYKIADVIVPEMKIAFKSA